MGMLIGLAFIVGAIFYLVASTAEDRGGFGWFDLFATLAVIAVVSGTAYIGYLNLMVH